MKSETFVLGLPMFPFPN